MTCAQNIEGLAGPAELAPIFRPVQFTLIPDRAYDFESVVAAMRHCDHLCTLLNYQNDTIKNTYPLRCSLIQHVFTQVRGRPRAPCRLTARSPARLSASVGQVIPLPLPLRHANLEQDLWRQPMRYETQARAARSTAHQVPADTLRAACAGRSWTCCGSCSCWRGTSRPHPCR